MTLNYSQEAKLNTRTKIHPIHLPIVIYINIWCEFYFTHLVRHGEWQPVRASWLWHSVYPMQMNFQHLVLFESSLWAAIIFTGRFLSYSTWNPEITRMPDEQVKQNPLGIAWLKGHVCFCDRILRNLKLKLKLNFNFNLKDLPGRTFSSFPVRTTRTN